MASIPLPALGIRPPVAPTDPVEQFSRLQAIRGMVGQQQLQQQEVQAASQENQLRQQQINDMNGIHQALNDSGGDPDKLRTALSDPKYGISPNGQFSTVKMLNEYKLSQYQVDQASRKNSIDSDNTIADAYNKIRQLPSDQQPSAVQDLKSDKDFLSKLTPHGQQAIANFQYAGPDSLTTMANSHTMKGTLVEQADKEASTAKNIAQTKEAEANTAKVQAETQGVTGPFAEAKYRNILTAMSAGKAVSDDDLNFARGYEAANAKTTKQSDTLGVTSTNTSAPSGLAAVGNRQGGNFVAQRTAAPNAPGQTPVTAQTTPAAAANTKQSIVDLIGQYKMDPKLLSRMMYKHPEMAGLVRQSYPDWDETSYEAKNKIAQNYTSGAESKSINAISTALGHAGELGQAIDALNNSDGLNMLRKLGNSVGVNVLGNDKVTAFNLIVHRLAPEIAAAYIQGGGGEGERGTNASDFAASLGNQQLRTNLGETVKLLRSKIAAQEQQWNNTYKPTRPEDDFATRFLTPGAKDALQKYSPQSGATAKAPPTGATHTGRGSVDKKLHYLDANGKDLGLAE